MFNMNYLPVTIAASGSLSSGTDVADYLIVGIIMPQDWTAANLTFQGGDRNSTQFNNVYDSGGSEVTITAAEDRHIVLDPALLAGVQTLKIRSGTSASAVAQAAARTITLVLRRP